ncbi:MAG: LuxR family transcriptional regulator [Bacteroidetes bacterium]|nr:MAG: LuxR family transcriptional regulator [Bacteroidota bacterium]
MDNQYYGLFHRFIRHYLPGGFQNINRTDPIIADLEDIMKRKNQFFLIGDLLNIKILFTSNLSARIIGVNPEDVTPYHFLEKIHPEQFERHNLLKAKLYRLGNDLFSAGRGEMLLSTDFKFRNNEEIYRNCLIQCYNFYSDVPYKTAYALIVITDIDRTKRNGKDFHYYLGNDLSYFKYPDEKLLMKGTVFSNREFQIMSLIAKGLNSDQISKIIHISKHTVNTHRRNILVKTEKESIYNVIFNLKEQGLL